MNQSRKKEELVGDKTCTEFASQLEESRRQDIQMATWVLKDGPRIQHMKLITINDTDVTKL